MTDPASAATLIGTYGLAVLMPLAIIEGPVVTIIAGWMARLGLINPIAAYVALVAADLIGDLLLYAVGHRGLSRLPEGWRNRLGLTDARMARVTEHFRHHGPRTLVFGKLAHTPGAAVLVAAGSARMPIASFLLWNLLPTLPKSALFFALGWVFGTADQRVETALIWMALLLLAGFVLFLLRLRKPPGYPAE